MVLESMYKVAFYMTTDREGTKDTGEKVKSKTRLSTKLYYDDEWGNGRGTSG